MKRSLIARIDEEVKREVEERENGLKSGYEVLHPRITWFYKKWRNFYNNNLSIKSLPMEDSPLYEEYRKNRQC